MGAALAQRGRGPPPRYASRPDRDQAPPAYPQLSHPSRGTDPVLCGRTHPLSLERACRTELSAEAGIAEDSTPLLRTDLCTTRTARGFRRCSTDAVPPSQVAPHLRGTSRSRPPGRARPSRCPRTHPVSGAKPQVAAHDARLLRAGRRELRASRAAHPGDVDVAPGRRGSHRLGRLPAARRQLLRRAFPRWAYPDARPCVRRATRPAANETWHLRLP